MCSVPPESFATSIAASTALAAVGESSASYHHGLEHAGTLNRPSGLVDGGGGPMWPVHARSTGVEGGRAGRAGRTGATMVGA